MNCDNCKSELQSETTLPLRTGCASFTPAIACGGCGRLHWTDGRPVFNRQDHAAYLENGSVVNKDANGVVTSRF